MLLRDRLINDAGYSIAVRYSSEEFPEDNALAEANLRHEIMSERVKSKTSVIITNIHDENDLVSKKHRPHLGLIVHVEDLRWQDNGKFQEIDDETGDYLSRKSISTSVAVAKRGKVYLSTGGKLQFEMPGDTEVEQIAFLLRKCCQAKEHMESLFEVIVMQMTDEMIMMVSLISADFPTSDVVLRCADALFAPRLISANRKLDFVYRFMFERGTERVTFLEQTAGIISAYDLLDFSELEKAKTALEIYEEAKKIISPGVSGNIEKPDLVGKDISSSVLRMKYRSETNRVWRFWIDCDSGRTHDSVPFSPVESTSAGFFPSYMTPSTVFDVESGFKRVAGMLYYAGLLSAKERVEPFILEDYMHILKTNEKVLKVEKKHPIRQRPTQNIRLTPPDISVFLRIPKSLVKTQRISGEELRVSIPPPVFVTGTVYCFFPICWLGRYADERDFEITIQSEEERRLKKFFDCDRIFAMGERILCLVVDTRQFSFEDEENIEFLAKSWMRARTKHAREEMVTPEEVRMIDLRFMISYSAGAATDFHEATVEKTAKILTDVSVSLSDAEILEIVLDPWIAQCVMSRVSKEKYETEFRDKIGLFEFEGREPLPLPTTEAKVTSAPSKTIETEKKSDANDVSKIFKSTKETTESDNKESKSETSNEDTKVDAKIENKIHAKSFPSHPYYQYMSPVQHTPTFAKGKDTLPLLLIDLFVRNWDAFPKLVLEALINLPFLNELDWHFPVTQGMKIELIRKTFWIILPLKSQAEEYARFAEERLRTKSDYIRIGAVGVVLMLPEHFTVKLGYEKE